MTERLTFERGFLLAPDRVWDRGLIGVVKTVGWFLTGRRPPFWP